MLDGEGCGILRRVARVAQRSPRCMQGRGGYRDVVDTGTWATPANCTAAPWRQPSLRLGRRTARQVVRGRDGGSGRVRDGTELLSGEEESSSGLSGEDPPFSCPVKSLKILVPMESLTLASV